MNQQCVSSAVELRICRAIARRTRLHQLEVENELWILRHDRPDLAGQQLEHALLRVIGERIWPERDALACARGLDEMTDTTAPLDIDDDSAQYWLTASDADAMRRLPRKAFARQTDARVLRAAIEHGGTMAEIALLAGVSKRQAQRVINRTISHCARLAR